MKLLITGGCGFVGSNLARGALLRGADLVVLDNLSRVGSTQNLEWLRTLGGFVFEHGDVRNQGDLERVVVHHQPEAVFHVAGQVSMLTSLESPRLDFEVNALGTFNLLDALRRHCPQAMVLYSSSNKVYGDLAPVRLEEGPTRWSAPGYPAGLPEDLPLSFHSPYGCSKGAAEQYLLDYHRMYGLRGAVFRHSSMYGPRQFATYGQGWVGWFCERAVEARKQGPGEGFTISGDGKQVRDLLYADDLVALYFAAVERMDAAQGQAFNIGGGPDNSLSLLELFAFLEAELGVRLNYRRIAERQSDQKFFVADNAKAQRLIGWRPRVGKDEGLRAMIQWVRDGLAPA